MTWKWTRIAVQEHGMGQEGAKGRYRETEPIPGVFRVRVLTGNKHANKDEKVDMND